MPWAWVNKLLDSWQITPPINESLAILARDQRLVVPDSATTMSPEVMAANNRLASATMSGSAGTKKFADLPPFMQAAIMASRSDSKAVN